MVKLDIKVHLIFHRKTDQCLQIISRNKIFHVHARDTDGSLNYSLPAGSGILDWPMIFKSLRKVDFDGFVSIELGENCRAPEIHLKKSRDYLREVIKDTNEIQ